MTLSNRIIADGNKSTLNGAGRAIAFGALVSVYQSGLNGEEAASSIGTLTALVDAMNVDWRIIGLRALQLAVKHNSRNEPIDSDILKGICDAVLRGMGDYTIDERGDVGSLVRLQAMSCAAGLLELPRKQVDACPEALVALQADVVRLSLEKLDRVRLQAAQCRSDAVGTASDIASVSSCDYFSHALRPLEEASDPSCPWPY